VTPALVKEPAVTWLTETDLRFPRARRLGRASQWEATERPASS
jgi:predicted DNA-binding transcriptional regulator AlpA